MIHRQIHFILIAAIVLLVLSVTACNTSSKDGNNANDTLNNDSTEIIQADVSYNKEISDIALFIAGLPVDTSSPLYELTLSSEWKSFSKRMDEKWTIFFNDVDANITPWVNKEIGAVSDTIQTLFYPFSGPDFINADVFFPDMENYIFFGLEPPGSLPDPLSVKPAEMPSYYKMYEKSIEHIIYLSFFRTHSMKADLSTMEVDGAAPVILIFMARAGKKIIDIKPFRFADDGTLSYDTVFNAFKPHEKFKKGVEITFRNENDPKVQKLVYFSIDISDNYLAQNTGVKTWLNSIDSSCAVYIKSASYLLHDPYFETIKALILEKGSLIVQDDSGMPYKFFDKSKWAVGLHGTYDMPIPIFSKYFQKEMRDDYLAAKTTDLPFRRGYAKRTNLQVARKK